MTRAGRIDIYAWLFIAASSAALGAIAGIVIKIA
jgi:hypothetical protein